MASITINDYELTAAAWAADGRGAQSLLPGGAKVQASQFNATDAVVVTASATANAGATSISVDALSGAIPSGTILNFGSYAPVTVTVNDGSVSAGDTTLTVTALSGPIPAGTFLDFSGGTNAQVVRLSADAAAAATSLTVYPLDGTIANTQTATFPGGTIQARLTAAAAAAATSLTVDELQFAVADDATATYAGSGSAKKTIKAGTLLGRTFAERDAGTGFGPADVTTPDDEIYLLAFDIYDAVQCNDCELYRHDRLVKENFLPGWSSLSSGTKTKIRALYQCIKGEA